MRFALEPPPRVLPLALLRWPWPHLDLPQHLYSLSTGGPRLVYHSLLAFSAALRVRSSNVILMLAAFLLPLPFYPVYEDGGR